MRQAGRGDDHDRALGHGLGAVGLHPPPPRALRPRGPQWEFPQTGPLSGANGALPWILFVRDRERFERDFPMWRVQSIRPIMPFRYLVSGGVSLRSLTPGWSFEIWSALEKCASPVHA